MRNILILGANGQVARRAIELFLNETDVELTLYLRNSGRLRSVDPERARVIEGDVLDTGKLKQAMAGQDVVYANLAGDLEQQAKSIVKAMHEAGVRRLVFISSMGIYDEVPGEKHGSILDPYRKAAKVIEDSEPRLHDPQTRLVHGCGRGRLRDDPEGRAFQREHRVAQERCSPGRQAGRVPGTGGSPQPGGKQARMTILPHGRRSRHGSRCGGTPFISAGRSRTAEANDQGRVLPSFRPPTRRRT